MSKESVQLYKCDGCEKEVAMPDSDVTPVGWYSISLVIASKRTMGDACSRECAATIVISAVNKSIPETPPTVQGDPFPKTGEPYR